MKALNLEHSVWKQLKGLGWVGSDNLGCEITEPFPNILVAFSGGVDSLALLECLRKLLGGERVAAAHFHHGPIGQNSDLQPVCEGAQWEYREQVYQFCEEWCRENKIKIFLERSKVYLASEAQQREARYKFLNEVCLRYQFSVLGLGHHMDDLLETRLLRLIRGVGPQGLSAMEFKKERLFRPFLNIKKTHLIDYCAWRGIYPLTDPSNFEDGPLRNWLRQEWLPNLESRCPGGVERLGHSLQLLVSEFQEMQSKFDSEEQGYSFENGIERSYFLTLSQPEQLRLLAKYLRFINKSSFGRAHLLEVCKRLDKSQKNLNFRVAGLNWIINAVQIKVES